MTKVRIFQSDTCVDLERQISKFLSDHHCAHVRFLQILSNGEMAYALLLAWEE